MRTKILIAVCVAIACLYGFTPASDDSTYLTYTVNPQQQAISMHWKNDSGQIYGSFSKVKADLARTKKQLVFAMNGGMYTESRSPLGLYIERGKTLQAINTREASGNFYMKPNGVFYVTDSNKAVVCKTEIFKAKGVRYATQSGPMLVIDGKIHSAFTEGSKNSNIRNGVGILPNGNVVFAMSKKEVNLYDFATYFQKLGCSNALYLDGFVSRTYLPEKNWNDTAGNFGVIIAVTK